MSAWKCGIFLLLAVQALGMDAKEEPVEEQAMSENSLDDDFLAQALAESLLPDNSSDPYVALPVLPNPDELEGLSPSEATPDGDGVVAAEDSADEEVVIIGAGEPSLPVPNPLGAFLQATQHIDVDLFAIYAQQPGLWQRLITRAWKQAVRFHHPDAQGDHHQFLEFTEAKDTLFGWAEEFKAVRESWPDATPHCFCDKCRQLLQRMLNCPKCLGLKSKSGHECGAFTKQFGIFTRTAKHKACILHLATLVAHGTCEERAIEEVKAQLACDQEAAKVRAELEAELAE